MYLSKSLLDQVKYYEKKVVENFWSNGFTTKIIIHFKQWWKPSKTFKFRYVFVRYIDNHTTSWRPAPEANTLERQLLNYLMEKDNEFTRSSR